MTATTVMASPFQSFMVAADGKAGRLKVANQKWRTQSGWSI